MIATDTSHILFLAILYAIGLTSFFFYSSDSKPETYSGKSDVIPSVPGSKWVIKVSFYATMFVTTLALLAPEIAALLVLWSHEGMRILGSIFAVGGISIFIAAKLTLGRHYSPCFKAYVPQSIIQEGIYKYIRHPIYTGNLLIFLGALIASGSFWMVLIFSAMAFLYYKTVQIEETYLELRNAAYSSYRKNTGKFVPKVIHRQSINASPLHRTAYSDQTEISRSRDLDTPQ